MLCLSFYASRVHENTAHPPHHLAPSHQAAVSAGYLQMLYPEAYGSQEKENTWKQLPPESINATSYSI
jgi:hypothetical protein